MPQLHFIHFFNMYMKGLDVDQRFADIYNPDSKIQLLTQEYNKLKKQMRNKKKKYKSFAK